MLSNDSFMNNKYIIKMFDIYIYSNYVPVSNGSSLMKYNNR